MKNLLNKKDILKFWLFTVLAVLPVVSYSQELKPVEYYYQYNKVYSDWLKEEGLDKYLSVDTLQMQGNNNAKYLTLYLDVKGDDKIEKMNNLASLMEYYKEHKKFSLCELLSSNMLLIYHLQPAQGNV